MSFRINEDILRLHIAVCNALNGVQEFQYQHDFCGIEASGVDIESFPSSQVCEDFSSGTVIKLYQSVILQDLLGSWYGIADQHIKTITVGKSGD